MSYILFLHLFYFFFLSSSSMSSYLISVPSKERDSPRKRQKVSPESPCQRWTEQTIGLMCHDTCSSFEGVGHSNFTQQDNGTMRESTDLTWYSATHAPRIPPLIATPYEMLSVPNATPPHASTVSPKDIITPQKEKSMALREQFYLVAADPQDGSAKDKLNQVIDAKYKAGILKPYNYVNGYARLQNYMDQHMTGETKQRILNVMGTFRPAFRQVAQSLTDIDLILVEEAFDRLLLDYDRLFAAAAIPACLWRRTGEIYKGNKAFASLIDVSVEQLHGGRLCIYEIMSEESLVNYWEKYSNIAFDPRQKAVLTCCFLKHKTTSVLFSCCFSFTIRRDQYAIPTMIVGNFLPVGPFS
ncbi:hypothetical protein BDF14DRAFT_1810815 [Spinellus fusiger]|nr:hypothetical protein BDF14DRAFT_1810815 [Spinellus fusiger]